MRKRAIYFAICLGLLAFLAATAIPARSQHLPHSQTLVQQVAPTFLERGRIQFEMGRYSEAVTVWQQAAQRFETDGNNPQLALSLNYLSMAYQELGQWEEAERAIAQSLALLQTQPDRAILARSLNTRASLQLAGGETEAALETWKQAETIYAEAGDEMGRLGSQINQAAALQTLGLYRRSRQLLERVNQTLQTQPDTPIKATGLRSLGITLQVVGDLNESREVLQQSLAISQQLNSSPDMSATLFNLGNTARALHNYETALEFYHRAEVATPSPLAKIEAQLNQLSLKIETQDWQAAREMLPSIQSQLVNLPFSRATVYAKVNFAGNALKIDRSDRPEIAQVLKTAVQQARKLKDRRAESYALGQLGHLYEQNERRSLALDYTRKALILAREITATDIAYQWQWQLGRILEKQGDSERAIAAYSQAFNTLRSLRGDLVAINSDVQFSFRENVEPVYRQLVSLLLRPNASQKNLKTAREVIEDLQLAELDNFFRSACLDVKPEQIDRVDPTAAVIYPIILADRIEVILAVPGQPLRHYKTDLPREEIESILERLLQSINPAFSNRQRLRLSQQVYDWLIRPAETELVEKGIKTLVFVPDGWLRNLPMAVLHDGERYLVEKYSIALTQGLQLLDARSLARDRLTTLTAGLTEARQGFSALPAVESEVNQIASQLPSEVLLNREFTSETLQQQIREQPFSVVHLATHGQFSSNADETFLLTWSDRVNVKQLDELLSVRADDPNPIELLVLSACQTATGDKRAALGLAGVAVRSGARSTLATLWSVNDESTANLIAQFYQQLIQPRVSKAEAIRQAQLALLKQPKYEHPFFWAPFVLVGNWL